MATSFNWLLALALLALAAFISAALIVALRPWLVRYALARPNARSSHSVATPQGGGIAVLTAATAVTIIAVFSLPIASGLLSVWVLLGAAAFLGIVGAVDDIRTIEAMPRLIMQFVAVSAVVMALPGDLHVVPMLPPWIERAALIFAGVWFVNLTNFMDGIDWMTVTEIGAIAVGLLLLAAAGALPPASALIAAALLGALIGFAPFNRPVAKLFLGDVGSLPIGLIVFWLLIQLAEQGHLAAALLLPLYYLADATVTLLARIARRESIMQAHRGHFYQRATNLGFSVPAVIAHVAVTNAILVVLALVSVIVSQPIVDFIALIAGVTVVGALLYRLTRGTS